MARTGSWCLSPKIKIRNASVFRMKSHRRDGPCVVHFVLKQGIPHSLSLWHLKVHRIIRLRWKLRKMFWQWKLLQRNNLLKENMEVPTQTNEKNVSCNLSGYERRHLFVSSSSAFCYSVVNPWEEHKVICFWCYIVNPQFIIFPNACSRKSLVPWQAHEEIIIFVLKIL